MAKPISPSYPVIGNQARELLLEIEKLNRGEITDREKQEIKRQFDNAAYFFKNAENILGNKKPSHP